MPHVAMEHQDGAGRGFDRNRILHPLAWLWFTAEFVGARNNAKSAVGFSVVGENPIGVETLGRIRQIGPLIQMVVGMKAQVFPIALRILPFDESTEGREQTGVAQSYRDRFSRISLKTTCRSFSVMVSQVSRR